MAKFLSHLSGRDWERASERPSTSLQVIFGRRQEYIHTGYGCDCFYLSLVNCENRSNRRATDGFDHLIYKSVSHCHPSMRTPWTGPTRLFCKFPRQTWSTILQSWNKPWDLTVPNNTKLKRYTFLFTRYKIRMQNHKTERITRSISKNPLVKIHFLKAVKPQTTTSGKQERRGSRHIYYLELGSVRKPVITNSNTLEPNLPKQLSCTIFLSMPVHFPV